MKNKIVYALVIMLSFSLVLLSCKEENKASLWEGATYTEDKSFGEGEKTVDVLVEADERSVVFTVSTDAKYLGDALMEHGLVEGHNTKFGLYIKRVNGILADYDVDGYYWALTKSGEYLMTGADATEITDGEKYELTRTK